MTEVWYLGDESPDHEPCKSGTPDAHGLLCTRSIGHGGPHIAQSDVWAVLAVWNDPDGDRASTGSPPDGWFPFGSHVEWKGPLEFSEEKGEDGLPLWERHAGERPDDGEGHLFRFSVVSQARYSVTGRAGYTDADWGLDEEPWTAEVRAWDLPTALRRLADQGIAAWDTHEEET